MQKIVVLGRGGAGKSTFARELGAATGIPVVELDAHFWTPDLVPMSVVRWVAVQEALIGEPAWIMDGDLGPYDVLEVRLRAADTVVVLDFSLWRCAWRALRRSRENLVFWRWLIGYRRHSLPAVRAAIGEFAETAQLHVLRTPRAVENFLSEVPVPGDAGALPE
ncbi:adenylate kinase [Nocardia yunnanensis]|uniref:Adenylate kinase n=1 Tax=Nocardia yunnanensis TaxID=2382165 RepID=A0A386ZD48_9NOCA|nr:adenylate kinase [Nocardia yunnanensis]AYF74555.1 adenylate kinase [Nocardia yunnanensis]